MRSSRHVDKWPTMEILYDTMAVAGGAAFGGLGGFYGGDLDADGEYCYIECLVPHDFTSLKNLVLVLIPVATDAAMTLRVTVNYCRAGEPYTMHNKTLDKSFVAVTNVMTEVGITDLVDLPNAGLDKQDYLGISISRQVGQNLDAIIIGARMRYI